MSCCVLILFSTQGASAFCIGVCTEGQLTIGLCCAGRLDRLSFMHQGFFKAKPGLTIQEKGFLKKKFC